MIGWLAEATSLRVALLLVVAFALAIAACAGATSGRNWGCTV